MEDKYYRFEDGDFKLELTLENIISIVGEVWRFENLNEKVYTEIIAEARGDEEEDEEDDFETEQVEFTKFRSLDDIFDARHEPQKLIKRVLCDYAMCAAVSKYGWEGLDTAIIARKLDEGHIGEILDELGITKNFKLIESKKK